MFSKLLIANRGEIACRIIKTAKKLGIKTVAVYSDIDRNAMHVELADEAYPIGPAASIESYLNSQRIISVAKQVHAQAIHPGYGFLSEDAEFAEQCQQAGLIFIGPPIQAIKIMGDKNLAKKTMLEAGVPVISGYHEEAIDLPSLKKAAKKLGLPILIKAAAGGGGKGMRLVQEYDQLEESLHGAMREAQASFGDSRVFLEKYLESARHIEVQILFDQYGHGIHLFDRDCSTQRRHQKVIEEAPAPFLKKSTREKMAITALQAGQAIHYTGVGTIEFLVDADENHYFMEMNTRLQVEHPVTEMITGLDLVEWQLRVASGEKLTLLQSSIHAKGHAIEARLYAENPEQNYIPCAGPLTHFSLPPSQSGIRIDTGFRPGDHISVYYDPLIAKIIAWAEDRASAIKKLQHALMQMTVYGIHTNLVLLNRIIRHPEFINGKLDTSFLDCAKHSLLSNSTDLPNSAIIIACLAILQHQQKENDYWRQQRQDQFSPWLNNDGWRPIGYSPSQIFLWHHHSEFKISVNSNDDYYQLSWNNTVVEIKKNQTYEYSANLFLDKERLLIFFEGEQWLFYLQNPHRNPSEARQASQHILAPMPGTLVAVYVKEGQTVSPGEKLLVMEAMKMEHTLVAQTNGQVQSIFYQPGAKLKEGAELISMK